MLSQKHNYSSNPLLIQAAVKAIERRKIEEALDPALHARRILGVPPDPWQAAMLRSAARQLIMLCSRQSGKSTVASILALHEALYRAPALVLLLSPSLRQSQELFRKVKDSHNALPSVVPVEQESALQLTFENQSRIVALPGKESTIRGFSGVSLLIVDEASRVDDALYQAVRPMLAVSQGRLITLSSPFGKRGWWFEAYANGGAAWDRTKVTAYDCPRISREWLEEERKQIGEWWFAQEYEVVFQDDVSAVFRYEDIQAAMVDSIEPRWGIADALR